MNKIFLLSALFFSFLSTFAQEPHCGDKLDSLLKWERRAAGNLILNRGMESLASDNFDVKYYRCSWDIDPAVRYIGGEVTMFFAPSQTLQTLMLDLTSSLTVSEVRYRGNIITHSRPTNALKIDFPASIPVGKLDSLTIKYSGVPDNTGFGSFITFSHSGTPVAWSLSEPYGSRDWWPCKTQLGDKADSIDVYLTYPSAYKGASNGMLQSEVSNTITGKTTAHWKHRYPIASYLVCFAITNYTTFTNTVQLGNVTLPMLTYCYPESLVEFQTNTPKVLEAMKVFNQYFGDYPFMKEKYGHVQFGWGGGMEHQTSTFIVSTDESLMAHELGHQWFGDKITTNSWRDIWLNEGFATFLAAFYMEEKYPQNKISMRSAVVNNITSSPGGSVMVSDTNNVNQIFSGRLSYRKGAYLVNMLRFKLGDNDFFKGIKQYVADPKIAYGYATTADLKRNLEEVSGKNLSQFFKQWYEGEGYPSYHVDWSMIGSGTAKIKLSQTTSHSSVNFFQMPVPLLFKNGAQQKTVIVDATTNNQEFIRDLGFVADTVMIDPEFWLISAKNTTTKIPFVSTGTRGVDVYPSPVTDPLSIFIHDYTSSNEAFISVYNMQGQKMMDKRVTLIAGSEFLRFSTNLWPGGVYTVRVRIGEEVITKRIVK
jgi:aminopeptidase N